jgi:16S rRNA processing protein RimM
MHHKDHFLVGKIVKKFSFKGVILVKLDTDDPESFIKMESVFVDLNGSLIPFFIEDIALHKTELLRIQFEDVNNEQAAGALIGCNLYLPLDLLPKLSGNKFYYHEIIGFSVIDKSHGNIGTITGVNDQTAQALFEISHGDNEILIPIIDEFILEVNREEKTISVSTPDGLLELYL